MTIMSKEEIHEYDTLLSKAELQDSSMSEIQEARMNFLGKKRIEMLKDIKTFKKE